MVDVYKTVATTARSFGRILIPRAWAIEIQSQTGSFLDRRTRYCLAGASAIPTFSGSISTLWACYLWSYLNFIGWNGKCTTFVTYVIIVFHLSVWHVTAFDGLEQTHFSFLTHAVILWTIVGLHTRKPIENVRSTNGIAPPPWVVSYFDRKSTILIIKRKRCMVVFTNNRWRRLCSWRFRSSHS
jgi:hypothetical protein